MKFTRRRLLLGLGASAAVSGGVLGTGAFTSVQAKRTIDVDVAGDANAFVGLYDTSSGGFVDKNGGSLRIKLDSTGNGGSGVNSGTVNGDVATTTLDPAFTLKNQGADTMYAQVSHTGVVSSGGNDVQFIADDTASGNNQANEDATSADVITATNNVAFIDRADTGTTGDMSDDAVTDKIHSGGTTTTVSAGGYIKLEPGEAVDVILQVASDTTTTGGIIPTATIEAFDSSSASGLYSTAVSSTTSK